MPADAPDGSAPLTSARRLVAATGSEPVGPLGALLAELAPAAGAPAREALACLEALGWAHPLAGRAAAARWCDAAGSEDGTLRRLGVASCLIGTASRVAETIAVWLANQDREAPTADMIAARLAEALTAITMLRSAIERSAAIADAGAPGEAASAAAAVCALAAETARSIVELAAASLPADATAASTDDWHAHVLRLAREEGGPLGLLDEVASDLIADRPPASRVGGTAG